MPATSRNVPPTRWLTCSSWERKHEDYDAYIPPHLLEIYKAWDIDQPLSRELPGQLIQLYCGLAHEMADWPVAIREPHIAGHVSLE
jgi:hypothetical protein